MQLGRGHSTVVAADTGPQPTAKDLTEADRRRLNGGVEYIIQKGATSQQEALELVRSITHRHLGEDVQDNS